MIVYISSMQRVIATILDVQGAQEEESAAVMKRGTTYVRVLWLSGGDSCQPSWDLWRGVVMEAKENK